MAVAKKKAPAKKAPVKKALAAPKKIKAIAERYTKTQMVTHIA